MDILKNKIKFLSLIHSNNKLNLLFIGILIYSLSAIYINNYNEFLLTLSILICIKITHMYMELGEHFKTLDYSKWLLFKNNTFIKRILKYSIYVFTLFITYISITSIFNFYITESILIKFISFITLIFVFTIILIYYKLLIKFKQ